MSHQFDRAWSPADVCVPVAAAGPGPAQQWSALPLSWDTFVRLAVSRFSDLAMYRDLSQASKAWRVRLAPTLLCIRDYEIREHSSRGLCHICAPLGLPHGLTFECSQCEDLVCEDCVVFACYSGSQQEVQ